MAVIQTRSWQQEIIAGAAKKNELHCLHYVIEMHLPKYLENKTGQRRIIVQEPYGYIPTICLAPDPEEAYLTAMILQRLLALEYRDWISGKPSAIEFKIMLILIEDMPTPYWYEWWPEGAGGYPTNVIDRICAYCGQVSQVRRDHGWFCECGVGYDAEGLALPEVRVQKEGEKAYDCQNASYEYA